MMDDQNPDPLASSEDRVTRALPYVVGLFVAFGLLIYNSTQGPSGDDQAVGSGTTVADETAARLPVGAVRRALDAPGYGDVDVGEYNGTIILTGSVIDEASRLAAGDVAEGAADGAPVDNRIAIGTAGSDDGGDAAAGVPVTAAASTVSSTSFAAAAPPTTALPAAPAPAPATAAETTAAETTAAETTAAPETSAAAESTVVTESETTVSGPAPAAAPEGAAPAPAPTPGPVAPVEPTTEELNTRLSELLKAEPIQFERLASRIESASFATLDRAAALIMSSTTARFEVQGHTDSGGQPSFNQRLSEQRSNSVRTALVDRGVPADRLVAVGYGETRPTARNATPEGRSLNRRVEIVVVP